MTDEERKKKLRAMPRSVRLMFGKLAKDMATPRIPEDEVRRIMGLLPKELEDMDDDPEYQEYVRKKGDLQTSERR